MKTTNDDNASASVRALLDAACAQPRTLSQTELTALLSLTAPSDLAALFAAAASLKKRLFGARVAVRGLVEAGNVCAKNCLYCGIRRENGAVARYRLTADEIVQAARRAAQLRFASLVIQAGEMETEANTLFFESLLKRLAPLDLGVTLSLGEQTPDVYCRWKEAGAARYLLRIETSNPDLYARLHPASHDWARRVDCLRALRRCGYQVGTGVMCGLPGQTMEDLARDILFFAETDVDMIGMGPFIPHAQTPLAHEPFDPAERLLLGLKMIAVTRLHLHDVNIAASTALQALAPDGRERGLLAGANVIMPNLTDPAYRARYQLYDGKPGLDEETDSALETLRAGLAAVGAELDLGRRGDSLHYQRRKERAS